jgi:hypothetical protein
MRSSWLSIACGLSAAISQSSSAALINPISQSRSVSAQAQVFVFPSGPSDFDSASDAAPDFGPFQSGVTANAEIDGTTASASAAQSSGIASASISASGSADANSGGLGLDIAQGEGASSLSIRFEVPEDVLFQLEVGLFFQFMLPANQRTYAWFELRGGPDDQIIASWHIPDSVFFSDFIDGVLLAGEYHLQANAAAFAEAGDTAHSQFYFNLVVVPEPSTGLLLAAGLLVLGSSRRSRG